MKFNKVRGGVLSVSRSKLALAMALGFAAGAASAQTPTQTTVGQGGEATTTETNPFLDNATAGFQFRTATFKRWSPGADPVRLY